MILRIFLLVLLLAASVAAQTTKPAPPQTPNELVKAGFEEVNEWVVKSAEMVPPDKYNYKPADTVRTFGQLIAHITDSYNYFCTRAVGTQIEYTTPVENGKTDKDTLIPKLREAVGRCTAAYDGKNSQLRPLFANVGHTNLHYGNIITYMRMMGLKPPSC
jgi:uncharacterized damage-inducible protein DinB